MVYRTKNVIQPKDEQHVVDLVTIIQSLAKEAKQIDDMAEFQCSLWNVFRRFISTNAKRK
jgi:hypothetical protein